MDEEKIEQGIKITPDDEFWVQKMHELIANSIISIEEAAKQLINMITVMQGIYVAVLSFSGIKEISKDSFFVGLFYISPIFLWLFSLFFVLAVFKTQKYNYYSNSPDSSEKTFWEIAEYKQTNLDDAYKLFCIGFSIAAFGILYWLCIG